MADQRIPPQAIEAEQSVLGAILQHSEALHVAMEMLKEDYFYLPKHRKIFASIRKLYESSSAVDLITISAELSNQGLLDEIGGRRYLMDLTDSVVTFSNIEDHCRLVLEAAVKNQLINNCSDIINRSYDTSIEADNLLDYAESRIFTIKEDSLKGEIYHLRPILETALRQIEEYSNRAGYITGVPSGYPNLDEMTSGFQPSELVIIAARPSMGKAQPLDAKILMANGEWGTMGDIAIGDELASIDGQTSRVTGIYPQGVRQVYRMTFADGRSTECCAEHLWRVYYRSWDEPRILSTARIIELLSKKRYRNRLWIETFSGEYGSVDNLPVDPWLLGVLLGDGALGGTSLRFSSADDDLLEKVEEVVGAEMAVTHAGNYDYRIKQRDGASRKGVRGVSANPITASLRQMGLWDVSSESKFIPAIYLRAPMNLRIRLLAGLLDTDGWVEKFGALRFATCSRQLAINVVDLVRSLGGTASFYDKETTYTYKGEKLSGKISYVCNIQFSDSSILQLIKRKSERIVVRQRTRRLNIADITPTRATQTQCIMVSHPSHLYITDDYIVTHNTAFALNIADYVAIEKGTPVCIFSLEMSKEALAQRLLCSRARISAHHMKTGRLADHQWTNLSIAAGPLSEAPIYLDDSASLSVLEIRAKARRMKHRHDIGLLIVDYLQLVKGQKNTESRQQEISYISQSLKSLARELKIPVIALSQLSRQIEMRGPTARPKLSDLRESGAIEQDADMVIFIHRPPGQGNQDEESASDNLPGNIAEIIIGKQRNGPTGMVSLAFVKDFARFELLDIHHGAPY